MASLFRRLQDLFAANLDELLDRESHPGTMLAQVIDELSDNLTATRDAMVDALNSEQQLQRELQNQRLQAQRWRERASQALKQDNEALAREALARKRDFDALVETLGHAHDLAHQTSEKLRLQLRALEARLAETQRQQYRLKQNHDDDEQQGAAYAFLAKMGAKLADMRATLAAKQADPRDDLARNFRDIEQEAQLESELAALRQELDRNHD